MSGQGRDSERVTEDRMDELLGRARCRDWSGSDRSPRVEAFLKGVAMKTQSKFTLSRTVLLLIGVGALAGGSLAAAVTHQIISRRAVLVTDDGTRYEIELLETPEGAAGSFVTDDGSVYGVEMVEQGGQKQMTVDIDSVSGGMTTVELDNGMKPRVLTAPGQKATISISESADEDDAAEDDTAESGSDE